MRLQRHIVVIIRKHRRWLFQRMLFSMKMSWEDNFFEQWPCKRSLYETTSRFWNVREGTSSELIVLNNLWIEASISSLVHQDKSFFTSTWFNEKWSRLQSLLQKFKYQSCDPHALRWWFALDWEWCDHVKKDQTITWKAIQNV